MVKHSLNTWAKKYLSFLAIWYYVGILFTTMGGISMGQAFFRHDTLSTVFFALFTLICTEATCFRYTLWRPDKSRAFRLGAASLLDVIHTEGVFKYKRDGDEFAIYSNRVASAPPKDQK